MIKYYAVCVDWYNDIKDKIQTYDPYYYTFRGREYVEFGADEEEFEVLSAELDWV